MISAQLLGDELLRAIGSVAVESAYLEGTLEAYIKAACRFDDSKTRLFVTGVLLQKKLDLVRDLYEPVMPDAAKADFAKIISEIKELCDKRNTIIHGLWFPPQIVGQRDRWQAFGEPKATRKVRTSDKAKHQRATEVLGVARKFSESHHALMRLFASNIHRGQLWPGEIAEPHPAVNRPSDLVKK